MNKYQSLLITNINKQLEEWFEAEDVQISHADIGRFLHTIAGTAGTVGLTELSHAAKERMLQWEDMEVDYWSQQSIREFLFALMQVVFNIKENGPKAELIVPSDLAVDAFSGEHPLILVLDDDAAFLTYMKDELEKRAYTVIAVDNADQAIEAVHKYQPDCLVLDLHSKDTNGFEVMSSLSTKIKREFLPTTVVSADDRSANRIKAYQLGADDFVSKPLIIEEFAAIIERQLSRKRLFEQKLIYNDNRSLKVAIVDDDAVVRTLLTEYVKSCITPDITTEIRVYRDGEAFFEDDWCKGEGPYFIILDRMMPRMDGLEVLQRIRSSKESEQYTILMLTGKKTEADIVKALQLGADDYVTKPFSLKELEARISRLTQRIMR